MYNSPTYQQPVQQQQPVPQQWHPPPPVQMAPTLPDPRVPPNPMEPMLRPGNFGPPYYFTQYPEEKVSTRLAKNMLLRGLEAIFRELANFFANFTWPKR